MIQQVNLYKDSLKQGQAKPVFNNYIYGFAGIIVFLIGYSLYLFIDINNTKDNIQTAKQQLTFAEAEVQRLRGKYPRQQINKLLIQEISYAEKKLESLSQVVHLLNDKTSDTTQGFSRYFSALAKQSVPEIWLSHIAINGQEQTIILKGSTYQAEKIAVFLQNLPAEKIFQGRSFANLNMYQDEDNENQLNFVINTTHEPLEQENHE